MTPTKATEQIQISRAFPLTWLIVILVSISGSWAVQTWRMNDLSASGSKLAISTAERVSVLEANYANLQSQLQSLISVNSQDHDKIIEKLDNMNSYLLGKKL